MEETEKKVKSTDKKRRNKSKKKRVGGKHKVQVPYNYKDTAEDLYQERKGREKRKASQRKIKKMMKEIERYKSLDAQEEKVTEEEHKELSETPSE